MMTCNDDAAVNEHVDYHLTVAKVLTMIILGLGSSLLGVVPIELTKRLRTKSFSPSSSVGRRDHQHSHSHSHAHPGDSTAGSRTVSLLLCFGGGVLLCTTLLHLQPEVREGVQALQQTGQLSANIEYLGDLFFCAGFFLVFLVDELAHAVVHVFNSRSGRGSNGGGDIGEDVFSRSLSLRRSLKHLKNTDAGDDRVELDDVEAPKEEKKEVQPQREERYRQTENLGDVKRQQKRQCHAESNDDGENHSLRGFFTVLALSFHEIFEGMAIGLEDQAEHVWYLCFAVATHKLVIAFCIGLELAWSGTRKSVIIVYVATFSLVTPIGIAIGMIIMKYDDSGDGGSPGPVAVVLQGLASGTLLYVVFFEILARHKKSGWSHLLAVVIGFGFLLLLQFMTHHGHGHSHGHSHGPNHLLTYDDHNSHHNHTGHDHGHDNEHDHSEHDHDHSGHDHDHIGHDHEHHD